jgi:prepilin-type processing-associated H-X9-DG protein
VATAPTVPAPAAAPKTSGLAIASLVCSLLGCTGIGAVAGLILGFVALSQIKKSAGKMTGRGLAIAGVIISAIVIVLGIVFMLAIAIPWLAGARDLSTAVQSENNIKQLYRAALVYETDNKFRLPAAEKWPQVFKEHCGEYCNEATMADPSDPKGGRAYAMNAALGGKSLTMGVGMFTSETVLFFECAPGAPPAGGKANLPSSPRHGSGFVIGFCDGHVERVAPGELGKLVWNPDQSK